MRAHLRKYVGDGDEVSYQAWENIFLLLLHVPLHVLDHQVLRADMMNDTVTHSMFLVAAHLPGQFIMIGKVVDNLVRFQAHSVFWGKYLLNRGDTCPVEVPVIIITLATSVKQMMSSRSWRGASLQTPD